MLIIGDVHQKIEEYKKLLNENYLSIQLGDFGFKTEHQWFLDNINFDRNKINFGNHDDYSFIDKKHSLGNFYFYSHINLMTIRGAYSKDKLHRFKDIDWWENEELSYDEMNQAIDFYEKKKPEIVVSHDCPEEIRKSFFNITDKTFTSGGLQEMFEIHQPKLWIFGHHHKSKREKVNGTKFVCLNELEPFLI